MQQVGSRGFRGGRLCARLDGAISHILEERHPREQGRFLKDDHAFGAGAGDRLAVAENLPRIGTLIAGNQAH